MDGQYSRLEALIGKEKLERLKNASVAVIGCGAVGSFCLEPLIRAGIGRITVVDHDSFEPSNLNRQLLATRDTVGRKKVEVAEERILSINPDCQVNAIDMFLTKENAATLIQGHDAVFDCIDSVESKCALIETALALDIKIFSSMGAARKTDLKEIRYGELFKTEGDPLAKAVRQRLRKAGIRGKVEVVFSPETPKDCSMEGQRVLGSLGTVTALFGIMLAHKGIEYLTGEA
jgi:Dinucleotide-utilizing enzymes involved in molybdopterin and thiamine biosynthesis family 1